MGSGGLPPASLLILLFLAIDCIHLVPIGANDSTKLYIVYMGERKHEDPDLVTASHHQILSTIIGSEEKALDAIVYSYKHGFSGFAAKLTESQEEKIKEHPEVISVKLSRTHKLQTTRSWDFLGLNYRRLPQGLLESSRMGEDVIVGVVDSGIWPESRSFDDHGYSPVPSRWKGKCVVSETFHANNCSRKVIGARWYTGGVPKKSVKEDYPSPRDFNGHGTHTASTAVGSVVKDESFNGLGAGDVKGGAPRARLAIYKACWGSDGACSGATVLAAIDDAIHDGVDILSLSLGSQENSYGALHAVAKGITVIYAGGNDGSAPQTVENTAPWVVTVAASTIDRSFPTMITLGNNQKFVGQSNYYQIQKDDNFTELVDGSSCSKDDLNGTDVVRKIVLCFAPQEASKILPSQDLQEAVPNVLTAGGKGALYAQPYTTNLLIALAGPSPLVLVDYEIGEKISDYLAAGNASSGRLVKVSPARNVVGKEVSSPRVAYFSSRGPSRDYPEVLKPDIAAPGVGILAAKRDSYAFDTGTSMATPHVSGVAALLKSLHPSWSPAAIKSAIVTTASVTDTYGLPMEAEGAPRKLADPFDYGGGLMDPNRAADPGLIYDIDAKRFLKFFNCRVGITETCSSSEGHLYYLNLPSIAIPNLKRTVTVWRTVTNVGTTNAIYKAVVQSPPGVEMLVEPSTLVFNAGSKTHGFKVTFTAMRKVQGDYKFGSLTWKDNNAHSVRIPIAVRTVIEDFYADTA